MFSTDFFLVSIVRLTCEDGNTRGGLGRPPGAAGAPGVLQGTETDRLLLFPDIRLLQLWYSALVECGGGQI